MSWGADMTDNGKDLMEEKDGLRLLIVHVLENLGLRSLEEYDVDNE